ncbi:hypothetical protein HT031_003147 [Scenedesmus sp. PABB004]|nr:hypothetical protein HT031_003147 [Scenedesmus sp. PABB004]
MAQSCKAATDFNLAPTAEDEQEVWGAARPGARQQRCYDDAVAVNVTPAEVEEWVGAVKAVGVSRVVSMLSDSELATYEQPLPAALAAAFPQGYVNVDAKAPGAAAEIMAALRAARAAGDRVLVHCWGGGGRTGLVQAAWLCAERGFSPEAAAEAVTAYGAARGCSRRVDVAALRDFVAAAGKA